MVKNPVVEDPEWASLFEPNQTEDEELYLMMELLDGRSLKQILREGGPMTPESAVHIVAQVCDGVHHAHDNGVIHRDLKPDNILIREGSRKNTDFVKVLDFGVAKVRSVPGAESITDTGMVCGTPAYMSPEQAMARTIDHRSDVYAIAILLFEMLTGRAPFRSDTPIQLLLAQVNESPPELSAVRGGLPKALERVIMRGLSKEPSERPQSAEEFAQLALDALQDGAVDVSADPGTMEMPTSAPPEPAQTLADAPAPPEVPTVSALQTRPFAIGAILVAIALGYIIYGIDRRGPPPEADIDDPPAVRTLEAAVSAPGSSEKPAAVTAAPRFVRRAAAGEVGRIRDVAAAAPAPQAVAARAAVTLRTTPKGARVFAGQKSLGRTPLTLPSPADAGLRVTIKLRGYKTQQTSIAAGASGEVAVRLSKAARPSSKPGGVKLFE